MNIPAGPSDKIIIPSNFEINALKFQFHCFTLLSLYSYISLSIISMVWPYLGVKIGGLGGVCNYSGPFSAGGKLGRWRRVVVGRRWHQDQSDFSTEIRTRHWYWKTNGLLSFISPKGLSSPSSVAILALCLQYELFISLWQRMLPQTHKHFILSVATSVVPNDGFCATGDSEQ